MIGRDILTFNKSSGVPPRIAEARLGSSLERPCRPFGTGPIAILLGNCSMLAADYLRMKKEINGNGIIFSFSGFISEDLLFALGNSLKKQLSMDEADANKVKRVFSVFVEQVQNIIRYSAERHDGDPKGAVSSGVVTVGSEKDRFFVACGNIMRRGDVLQLKEKLELLRSLDPAGIKAYYLEKIKEPPEPGSLGANIGLIEIARRASEPIQFDFTDIDETSVFYCMKVFI
jgi:hypothetical protein